MRSSSTKNWQITHCLTPQPQFLSVPKISDYQIPQIGKKTLNPYRIPKQINPLTQRSRKHRLVQQRNTQIQKGNRMLYERIRKIKLKNSYQSERNIQPEATNQQLMTNYALQKPYSLPQISLKNSNNKISLNSTKSHLTSILEDRNTFVQKYFNSLHQKRQKRTGQVQLGNFNCHEWKIKVLLVDNQNLLLIGKKGKRQLTKKYIYSKVLGKMTNGLQNWVSFKFSFQE